jgi:hypothetical protein
VAVGEFFFYPFSGGNLKKIAPKVVMSARGATLLSASGFTGFKDFQDFFPPLTGEDFLLPVLRFAPKWSLALVGRLFCLNYDFGDSFDFGDFFSEEGEMGLGDFFCPFSGGIWG